MTILDNIDINVEYGQGYVLHEAWFKICDVTKTKKSERLMVSYRGIKLLNSYGRVRYVFDDGTYYDEHDGENKKPSEDWVIEDAFNGEIGSLYGVSYDEEVARDTIL